jgi:predicted Zn-dependent protease
MNERTDGGISNKEKPGITFIIYGPIEESAAGAFQGSIESYIYSIGDELEQFPSFIRIQKKAPDINTSENQHYILFEDMKTIGGNLKIGLTDVTLYSPSDKKNMFGYGNPGGMAIFSLTRFRNECQSKQLFLKMIEKESIKFLSLALNIPHCSKKSCIICYHRHVTDVGLNDTVCPECRGAIIREMNESLRIDDASDWERKG